MAKGAEPYKHPWSYKNFNKNELHDAKLLVRVFKEFPFVGFGRGSTNENQNFRLFLDHISNLSSREGRVFFKRAYNKINIDKSEKGLYHLIMYLVNEPFYNYFIKHGIEVKKYSRLNLRYGKVAYPTKDADDESDLDIMESSLVYVKKFWRPVDTKKMRRIKNELMKLKTKEAKKVGDSAVKLLRQFYKNVRFLEKKVDEFIDSM